MKDYD
jgi:propionyl-CoA synthetase